MIMKKILLIFLILTITIGAVLINCSGEKRKSPADVKNYVAFLDSKSAFPVFPFGNKPFYMFFNALWCPYSKHMREDIFSRPEIIEYLNENFTCISIIPDSVGEVEFLGQTLNKAQIISKFKLEGYPSHYFSSSDGKLIGARNGVIELLEFKQVLKYYSEGYYHKYDFKSFTETPEATMDTVYGKF